MDSSPEKKEYFLTVGLEIHAELNTRTKMFCNSKNDAEETKPNTNVCPVCLGYPGTLPVINKEAVKSILRLGTAVEGKLADYTEFDRKNYFYPDIPKGYQISQYKHPLVSGGEISGVKLTRIHLEEDTAKSSHDVGEYSLVDFNRAGVPLMELVTEPIMHTSSEAVQFAKELQLLLQYLGISEANMEKGQMRVEANISVSTSSDHSNLGTKVEVKNINSFKAVGRAIEFEFKRHVGLLEAGERVVQETRGWDENKEETFSQRLKESAHDYRYFPEPDLPKLFISDLSEFSKSEIEKTLPELPWQRRQRFLDLGVSSEHAEIYVSSPEWGSLFDKVSQILKDEELVRLASNYITTDLTKIVSAESLAEVIKMAASGYVSSRGAKDILKILESEGGDPRKIAEEKDLVQESDKNILKKFVEESLRENPGANIQFLIGQAMKKSKGKANPIVLKELFEENLNS